MVRRVVTRGPAGAVTMPLGASGSACGLVFRAFVELAIDGVPGLERESSTPVLINELQVLASH